MELKNDYQKVWTEGNILIFKWLPGTFKMSEQEYIEEIKKAAQIINKQRKPYIMLLAKEMLFIIPLSLQQKVNDILLPAYNESGVRKLAVIVPEQIIPTLSIEQTIEERRIYHNFTTRYFSDEDQARKWLLSQDK